MKILFLVLVGIFQALGCLEPIQSLAAMVMATGYFHDAQSVFTCLALAIIVFAAMAKFVPGVAGPFLVCEEKLKALLTRSPAASQASELAGQVQALAADVALIKSLVAPAQAAAQAPAADAAAPANGASQ